MFGFVSTNDRFILIMTMTTTATMMTMTITVTMMVLLLHNIYISQSKLSRHENVNNACTLSIEVNNACTYDDYNGKHTDDDND